VGKDIHEGIEMLRPWSRISTLATDMLFSYRNMLEDWENLR
jgi:hypothetical protein